MWQHFCDVGISDKAPSFLDAVEVWIKKPHVVNRQLCAAKLIFHQEDYGNITDKLIDTFIGTHHDENSVDTTLVNRLHTFTKEVYDKFIHKENMPNCDRKILLYARDLLPKSIDKHPVLREVVLFDKTYHAAYFIPVEIVLPDKTLETFKQTLGYKIELDSRINKLSLSILGPEEAYERGSGLGYTLPWLKESLLPKLAKWSTEKQLNTSIISLRLVPVDRYNDLYQTLKKKYGLPLVETWPEKTDPQKFVFEDVAISAYLLLLWEDDRRKKGITRKQSFVDLGCGNGLLVYILTSEGHQGLGLDIRKRKIWDMYGSDIKLKEQVVLPSDENLFPDYDWLIGNHSDELTPWIPVMAARSSYECNYFVLPCCPWDFNAKFSHKASGSSQYRNYLNFVEEVGKACGFLVEEDTLRIPSTKRVCFVGRSRTYTEDNEKIFDEQRQSYIDIRCKQLPSFNHASSQEGEGENVVLNDNSGAPLNSRTMGHNTCTCHTKDLQDKQVRSTVGHSFQPAQSDQCMEENKNDSEPDNDLFVKKDPICHMCGLAIRTDENLSSGTATSPCMASHTEQSKSNSVTVKRKWVREFQARDATEKPRNCVSVDSCIKDQITSTVFQAILGMEDGEQAHLGEGKTWRKGGSLALADVAALFDGDTLQKLKNECGGLQTLLRNSHHIFRVQGGQVTLRNWNTDDYDEYQKLKKKKKGKLEDSTKNIKTRLCYFNDHHPNGCPMEADKCKFAHGSHELRDKLVHN